MAHQKKEQRKSLHFSYSFPKVSFYNLPQQFKFKEKSVTTEANNKLIIIRVVTVVEFHTEADEIQ